LYCWYGSCPAFVGLAVIAAGGVVLPLMLYVYGDKTAAAL